jgi:hypothetical protein
MAKRDTNPGNQSEQSSSTEDNDMVRGRADEMEDAPNDSDEFEDIEDLDDEEEEQGEGTF